jgi:hemerythrin superfamily protein
MPPAMDAITLLRNDHKTVEQLFKRFEKAGDRAFVEKRAIVDRIIEELAVHAAIEEQVFYPVVRATIDDAEDVTLESLEEHHIVKWTLSELDGMDPSHERFDAKVAVLIESVRHHVEEEENELFPKVRRELGRAALADLGEALADAKQTAPTKPHPRSPDEPPGNIVAGAISGVVDRVSDNVSGIAQGGVTAVQDLIARILRMDRPKVSPTGSSTSRKRASDVRRAASAATDTVEETAQSATRGTRRTARTAKSSAKRTASTAKRGAKRTASTAKSGAKRTASTAKRSAKRTASTAKRGASKTAGAARGKRS